LIAVAAACGRFSQGNEDMDLEDVVQVEQDVHEDAEDDALLDEEKLSRKLDLYAACLDRSQPRIRASWARYVDDIDLKTGLPKRKDTQPFVYAIDKELDPCLEAEDRGKKLSPPLPDIESTMTAYLEASTRFAALTRKLAAYYEAKAYEADEWSEGKALAPELARAHETWRTEAERLVTAVSTKRDEVEGDMLALIESREGKGLRWHARKLALEAKRFRTCVERTDWTPKECQTKFDALRNAHEAFRAVHDADSAAARKVFWMLAYQTTADEYVEEAATLMRTFAKLKPKTRTDAVDALVRIHDDLASDHANLKFDFP
jgi:hypothetical protein